MQMQVFIVGNELAYYTIHPLQVYLLFVGHYTKIHTFHRNIQLVVYQIRYLHACLK